MPNLTFGGLPHSDIPESMAICAYPGLFAACRVLLRLREPRHPPPALTYFTYVVYAPSVRYDISSGLAPIIYALLSLQFIAIYIPFSMSKNFFSSIVGFQTSQSNVTFFYGRIRLQGTCGE